MIPQNKHAHVVGNKWLPLLNCDPRLGFDTPFAVEEIHILFDNLTERLPVHDRNLHLEVIALISYEYINIPISVVDLPCNENNRTIIRRKDITIFGVDIFLFCSEPFPAESNYT